MNDILRNCQAFVEILIMARSEMIRQWDKETFERAYNWAVYFEKVHAKLLKHPSRKRQLNEHLKQIIKSRQLTLGQEMLDFEMLSKSTDILLKTCLGNAWLSEQQLPYLLGIYSQNAVSTTDVYGDVLQHCFHLSCSYASLSVLGEMKDKLKYCIDTIKGDTVNNIEVLDLKCLTSDDIAMETTVQRLLGFLQVQLIKEEPIREDRKKQLESRLASLSSLDRGYELLLRCTSCHDNGKREAKEFIVDWLIAYADPDLWNSPPLFLSQTAFSSVEFFKVYLKFLLNQEYNEGSLDKLTECWRHLINGPDHVREICVKTLKLMPLNVSKPFINNTGQL